MDKFLQCSGSLLVDERRDRREETVLEVLGWFDSVLAELSSLEELPLISEQHSLWADQMVNKIQSCKLGLRFMRMFFWSHYTLEDADAQSRQIWIPELYHTVRAEWGISRNEFASPSRLEEAKLEIENRVLRLQDRILHCKQKIEEACELLLQCSLKGNSFKLKEFLDAILENLKDLYRYKTEDEIVLLKNLEKKLSLLHNLLSCTPMDWRGFKELQEFKVVVHAFAQRSASLIYLYWVKPVNQETVTKLNLFLFNVLQKIKPCDPSFKAFYIRFLKEMKLSQFDSLLLGQIVQSFLDLLLENLVVILKEDFQNLQEGLMFIIAFLANPPDQLAENDEVIMITAEIEGLVNDDLYLVLSIYYMEGEGNFSKANERLSDLMRKVKLVKGNIRQVYDQIRDSFSYDFPKTNGLGFFDFLLQNLGFLKDKVKRDTNFIPFAKQLIIEVEEELMSLRPYLNELFEQQKEQKESKDTWLKVISLAYKAEYAINSCLVIGHPLWYNMARLMEVLDEIKVVKSKLKKIEGRKMHDRRVQYCSAVALNRVSEYPWTSSFNEVMVGLKEEVDIIVENLIMGSKFLDIVAIVGMPGLGKTTLANEVYNASAVRRHFHMFAYCIVSQVHNTKKILLDILGDIKGKDDILDDMLEGELADMLRRCLKGQRYLIVMDDIWDVKAWVEVERLLPDDENGSRVIFTTRIQNVALQVKQNCILHHLRFMSDEESWEMLQKKAFDAESCPPDFSDVGRMIAKNCKGLPLTIVSIADLVARSERSLSRWNTISVTISSYVSTQHMGVLESSYQHLPEHLKPCFLYFGAFAEDRLICVNKLTLLWIAEGFVQNSNMKNLENLAKEYLCDLVDRSLVIADERSSYGGIKSCRIHDLVHEFCQGKAREENFLQLMDKDEASNSSSSTVRNPYRVCIHMKGNDLSDAEDICPTIHSLLSSRKTYRDDHHYVRNLKLVQVMYLEELKWDACYTGKVIASLVHLRFIATSFPLQSQIIVPSFISNLWNLETLILTVKGSGRSKLELPGAVWNMTRLRHVDVGRCYLSSLGVNKHEEYPRLVNLESFSSPYITSTKDLEDLLRRLPCLQKLSFHYDNIREDFHFPELVSLSKLESLKVSSIRNPCLNSFNFLSNLKKLSLSDCHLGYEYLPVISELPYLEVLKLLDNAIVCPEWDMVDKVVVFPKLKFLKMQGLSLAEWIVLRESFPSLEVLIVNRCNNLNTIPDCFGELPTLKRIEVIASDKAVASVAEIWEMQNDYGNKELEVITKVGNEN